MSLDMLPILVSDSYKQFHHLMYPENMVKLYSNMTPRKSRLPSKEAVWFGLQYYLKEYLIKQWDELFFDRDINEIVAEYKKFHKYFSQADVTVDHLVSLHELGYMPLLIKALPEGELVPMKVPFYTIVNTHPDHGWLVNFLETQMSTVIWDITTLATISYEYRKLFSTWAIKTTGSTDRVQWQAHDFAMRGRSSIETSCNQLAHLTSFTGTDTIPAVLAAIEYYNADLEKELIGGSVPATEHSVMTSYGKESEIEAFKRLLTIFPKGILSVVADSFDLYKAVLKSREELYDLIMGRDGTLVYRPDSGDPVKIISGYTETEVGWIDGNWYKVEDIRRKLDVDDDNKISTVYYAVENAKQLSDAERMGMVELLYDLFGGTTNELGYKLLDSHVGVIYGDSITLDRAREICERLEAKGFASVNWVAGIGSYTFNYNTRDSLGIAVKSTYCEIADPVVEKEVLTDADDNVIGIKITTKSGEEATIDVHRDATENDIAEILMDDIAVIEQREIFKDPITDDGTKKSAKGLLRVSRDATGTYKLTDQVSWDDEEGGELLPVFEDGELLIDYSLADVRAVVDKNINKYLNGN